MFLLRYNERKNKITRNLGHSSRKREKEKAILLNIPQMQRGPTEITVVWNRCKRVGWRSVVVNRKSTTVLENTTAKEARIP